MTSHSLLATTKMVAATTYYGSLKVHMETGHSVINLPTKLVTRAYQQHDQYRKPQPRSHSHVDFRKVVQKTSQNQVRLFHQ